MNKGYVMYDIISMCKKVVGLPNVLFAEKKDMCLLVWLKKVVEFIVLCLAEVKLPLGQCLRLGVKNGLQMSDYQTRYVRICGEKTKQNTRAGKVIMLDILGFTIGLQNILDNLKNVKFVEWMMPKENIIGQTLIIYTGEIY